MTTHIGRVPPGTAQHAKQAGPVLAVLPARTTFLMPGNPGYDAAGSVWNAMVDRRPRVIARCASPGDVVAAVRAARARYPRASGAALVCLAWNRRAQIRDHAAALRRYPPHRTAGNDTEAEHRRQVTHARTAKPEAQLGGTSR